MPVLTINHTGKFEKTTKFLKGAGSLRELRRRVMIDAIARSGVDALANATPVDTGETAASWYYEINETDDKIVISWNNSNVVDHVNIAIILQYGHATRNGGYVKGQDYINPALQPIFNKMADKMWKAVLSI